MMYTHMQINEGCICDTISNYGDTFGHIHVADAPGRHEPGTGEINYKKVSVTSRSAATPAVSAMSCSR